MQKSLVSLASIRSTSTINASSAPNCQQHSHIRCFYNIATNLYLCRPIRGLRKMPAVYSLWIVGRNGGLLYSRDFLPNTGLDFNDKLRLASSWFGMSGIAAQLSPVPDSSGIQLMQADSYDLHSFQSLTGTAFMLVTAQNTTDAPSLLQGIIYNLYCDYVLKNPFHQMDQVMKSELFDAHLLSAMQQINRRFGALPQEA